MYPAKWFEQNISEERREVMVALKNPLFQLGHVVATTGAIKTLADAQTSAWELLSRHVSGDFGSELDAEDVQANHDAIRDGERVLSLYVVAGVRLYVITEADRSSSTILRADEY